MTTQTRTRNQSQDQVARDTHATDAERSGGRRRLGAVLTDLGVLVALAEPEAAIALANGVPNLDDEIFVRFLYDSRSAA